MLALYVGKRLLMAVIVCLVVIWLLIVVVKLVPGDPASIFGSARGIRPSPQEIRFVDNALGLNKPITVQYWDFLKGAVHGDLGVDLSDQQPVASEVGADLPNTIVLALAGVFLSVVVGVPLGVAVSRHPNSIFDRTIRGVSIILISSVTYVVGLFLLIIFAVKLHWFPSYAAGSMSDPFDYVRHLILPALAIAIPWWGYLARLVRASMLEVMGSSYIRTARALGLRERVVFYRYALKNALVPVVALFGLMLGYTLAGTVYAEAVFTRNGLGSLAVNAVDTRNWPVIRAVTLVFAVFFIFANLLSDLSYRLLDPRIRGEEGHEVPV